MARGVGSSVSTVLAEYAQSPGPVPVLCHHKVLV